MSSAEVHLRSSINSSSSFKSADSVLDSNLYHHTSFPHFTAEACGGGGGGGSVARGRSRPRLTKLRKQSASQCARSRTAAGGSDVISSFDSVRSDQVTGNISFLKGFSLGSVGAESGTGPCDGVSSLNCYRKLGSEGFVFGAGRVGSDSARDSDFRQGTSAQCREGSGSFRREGTTERGTEVRKSDSVEFVFSAKHSDVKSKSGMKTASGMGFGDDSKNMRWNSERKDEWPDVQGFVFRTDRNGFVDNSNGEKGKSSECAEKSGSGDDGVERKFGAGVGCERQGSFCFGNCNGIASSVIGEKQESVGSMGNLDSGMGTSNAKAETYGNRDSDEKGNDVYGSTDGVSTAYCDIPAHKLTNDLKKLNINQSEGAGITRNSTSVHINSSTGFVFAGSEKLCGYSSSGSETNASGHQSDSDATCETNDIQNGTCSSAGIPCPKSSTSEEGVHEFKCGQIPEFYVPEDAQVNGATASFSSSSVGPDSHPNNYSPKGHFSNADGGKNCFTSIPEASMDSFMDFKPPTWDPSSFKDNLFPKLNIKLESTPKVRYSKEKGLKHTRRKSKLHPLNKNQTRLDHLSKEDSSLKTPDSSGCHSPMDFSPYQETVVDDQCVKASELNDQHSTIHADSRDEVSAAVGRGVDVSTTDQSCGHPDDDKLFSHNGSSSAGVYQSSGPEQFSSTSIADSGFDFSSNMDKLKAGPFCFVPGLGDSKQNDFAFSSSSTVAGASSSLKCKQKRKFRRKPGGDSFVLFPNLNGKFESTVLNSQVKEGSISSSATFSEACEKWRLRGNQAYKDGDLSKAEDFYTLGINSVPSSERSGYCIKPLLLCYSNRAATRMSLGRIREALGDCMMAIDLDPNFLKVQMRTANCHLLLGEVEYAQQCFSKCMESGSIICLDRRVVVEAAEGLQKAQQVVECLSNAGELLKKRTSDAAGTALELLTKALSISLYSEKLLQMKAEALLLLQKYDAAIQLCEQSQHLAEKNFGMVNSTNNSNISTCDSFSFVKLWRLSSISKCYFHLGRFEASLNVIEKLQQVVSVNGRCVTDNIEDMLSLAATIRELREHKNAGNENFKLKKYTEAVENYTAALSSSIISRPFAAICFCNRAASYSALGQIADAIADCSMAMALDGNYAKGISRRATIHEMVRDYEQAACDLRRLISVLETQSNQKAKQSDSPSGSYGVKELKLAHQRLLSVEGEAKKGTPLDLYLILGIKPDATASDIKKAYHKAALRHHPDKAGLLWARSEDGDEGRVWKEISQEVHKDADRLFKMIGEAYSVLSDPEKRSDYDLEEELRKASKQSNRGGGTCRRSSDAYGYERPSDEYRSSSDRYSSRRYGRDHWKTYGNSYSRW